MGITVGGKRPVPRTRTSEDHTHGHAQSTICQCRQDQQVQTILQSCRHMAEQTQKKYKVRLCVNPPTGCRGSDLNATGQSITAIYSCEEFGTRNSATPPTRLSKTTNRACLQQSTAQQDGQSMCLVAVEAHLLHHVHYILGILFCHLLPQLHLRPCLQKTKQKIRLLQCVSERVVHRSLLGMNITPKLPCERCTRPCQPTISFVKVSVQYRSVPRQKKQQNTPPYFLIKRVNFRTN